MLSPQPAKSGRLILPRRRDYAVLSAEPEHRSWDSLTCRSLRNSPLKPIGNSSLIRADVDSPAELRCRHVPMNLRVSNCVLQYATSLVEPYPGPADSHGDTGAWLTNWARKEGVTDNVAILVMALSCALSTLCLGPAANGNSKSRAMFPPERRRA